MIFSSLTFLFFFLPFVLIGYYFLPHTLRKLFLLVLSLFFFTWGEKQFVLLFIFLIGLNFVLGKLIEKTDLQHRRNGIYFLGIVSNLGFLLYFKYAMFLLSILCSVSSISIDIPNIHLPIGISFFTFEAISYLTDVYKKKVLPQENVVNFALFMTLFPHLIAGPVIRYSDLEIQLAKRKESFLIFSEGVVRFSLGLAKKMIIANPLGEVADLVFTTSFTERPTEVAWLGLFCYMFQIYFDFSGYSDMAIGLGKMFGFTLIENFNYPYIADSITDFWRRWHISLSMWFRDYVYIPLGGSRCGPIKNVRNLFIVFLLCGVWHGANWNFLFWGFWNGFFIVSEKHLGPWYALIPRVIKHFYVLLVLLIGWLFFRADNFSISFNFLSNLICLQSCLNEILCFRVFNREILFTLVIALLGCTPMPKFIVNWFFQLRFKNIYYDLIYHFFLYTLKFVFILILLVYSTTLITGGTFNPFIYFRF